jgi:hypothetical protein
MTPAEHKAALLRIEELMQHPITREFEELYAKVHDHESRLFPITPPTLPEAMIHRRQQMAWTQKEASVHANMPLSRWQVIEAGATPSFTDARKLHNAGIPAIAILR